jgi:hypothetical protein
LTKERLLGEGGSFYSSAFVNQKNTQWKTEKNQNSLFFLQNALNTLSFNVTRRLF